MPLQAAHWPESPCPVGRYALRAIFVGLGVTDFDELMADPTDYANWLLCRGPEMPEEHRAEFRVGVVAALAAYPRSEWDDRFREFVLTNCMEPYVRPLFEAWLMASLGGWLATKDAGPAELSERLHERFGPQTARHLRDAIAWGQSQCATPSQVQL